MYFELRMKPGRYATEARYDVEVHHDGKLVVIHERKDNPGMSITNAAEYVLTELIERRDEITRDSIFVEHYPKYGGRTSATWDLMRPTWTNGRITTMAWRSLGRQYFELLKGNFEAVFPITKEDTKQEHEKKQGVCDNVEQGR